MPDTSATLLERLRDRADAAAWQRLVDLYTPLIRGWLQRHALQHPDLDDLVQDILTVLVRELPAFEHSGRPGAFRRWLRTVTMNRLRAFGLGQLDPAASAEVEQHVTRCDACCRTLEELADDSLVAVLRLPAAPPGDTVTDHPPASVSGRGAAADFAPPPELAGHPRYLVQALLGRGGMGAVYRAEHRLMQRPVALKVIRRDLTDRPGVVERFRREVKAAARLAHPNIVTVHDAEQAGGIHFLVMECVEGTTLARLVEEQGPLPVAQACDYARQAALGLQHAFEHGMVHRDVKPANLMQTPDGRRAVFGGADRTVRLWALPRAD